MSLVSAVTSGLAVTTTAATAQTASLGTLAGPNLSQSRFTAAMAPILSLALVVAGCSRPRPMTMDEGPLAEGASQYCQSMVEVIHRLTEEAQRNDQLLALGIGVALAAGLVVGLLIGRHVERKRGGDQGGHREPASGPGFLPRPPKIGE